MLFPFTSQALPAWPVLWPEAPYRGPPSCTSALLPQPTDRPPAPYLAACKNRRATPAPSLQFSIDRQAPPDAETSHHPPQQTTAACFDGPDPPPAATNGRSAHSPQ